MRSPWVAGATIQDYEYQDNDGQHGTSSQEIKDARRILSWFKSHS